MQDEEWNLGLLHAKAVFQLLELNDSLFTGLE